MFEVQSCILNVTDICNEITGNNEIVLCDKVLIQNLISRETVREVKEFIYLNSTNISVKELIDIKDPKVLELLNIKIAVNFLNLRW